MVKVSIILRISYKKLVDFFNLNSLESFCQIFLNLVPLLSVFVVFLGIFKVKMSHNTTVYSTRYICTIGGFNVSNLMGIERRMIDIGKKITFYFLQNV
jgi:hypothetical protein